MDDVISLLCGTFGFNKYEAEAYVSLLKKPDTTAYEISNDSGIPQSKIYGTMKSLLTKRIVMSNEGKVTKYTALPFETFLADYNEMVSSTGKKISQYFARDNSSSLNKYVLHIEKDEDIITKVITVIKSCKTSLEIEIWEDFYSRIYDYLVEADARGVELRIIMYGVPEKKIGTIFYHEMNEMGKAVDLSGKWMTLIADDRETLLVIRTNGHFSSCIWTQNESVMMLSRSFIGHDILMAEIYKKFKKELDATFGKNLIDLRNKYNIF